jgi:hypothetical protein
MGTEQAPPVCPNNQEHGQMEPRPSGRQTYEQRFCGEWWDCTQCSSSTLFPSNDLKAQLAGMAGPKQGRLEGVLP